MSIGTTAASVSLAGGTAAAMSGWPPQDVVVCALVGGLASVWISARAPVESASLKWAAIALMQIVVSAATGISMSAIALAVAPGYEMTRPFAAVPHWALAGVIAAIAFKVGPAVWRYVQRRWLDAGDARDGEQQ